MHVSITHADQLNAKPDENKLGFGTIFTDHMFNMDYNPEAGWHNPRIEPYQALTMDPSTMVLHYGQGVFEGLKGYRTQDGAVQLFRPMENVRRLNRSAKRLCIPELDEDVVLESLKQLIEVEKEWVPGVDGNA